MTQRWFGRLALIIVVTACGCQRSTTVSPASKAKVSLRLEWFPQAQFAGYLVASAKGFYSSQGLDVELRPAGPDLKPQMTVASGSDDFGIGVANQVIAARSNSVPLKIVAQLFQDSANRYVLKKKNSINNLAELRHKRIGLWLGGDEAEFVSMLRSANMRLADVRIIPQGYTITPFLRDVYVLSEVTTYNELLQIHRAGYTNEDLQVLAPAQFDSSIVGDMVFTTEGNLQRHPERVRQFLVASMRGWQYCLNHRQEAVDIVMKANPTLNREEQAEQLDAVLNLISSGKAGVKGIGYMDDQSYKQAIRVLMVSGQLGNVVNSNEVFDNSPWQQVPDADKQITRPEKPQSDR